MATRLELKSVLEDCLGSDRVYFQPPPNFMLSYPCIVYSLNDIRASHGDNRPYKLQDEYTVTVMDADPDTAIPHVVARLPQCSFDRKFVSDQLNHYVFKILF